MRKKSTYAALFVLLLGIILLGTGGHARAAGYISAQDAQAIALEKAGGGTVIKCKLDIGDDRDDIPEYEIEIVNGDYEYEVDVHAVTGKILDFDRDRIRGGGSGQQASGSYIDAEYAKAIALERAGGGTVVECRLDDDRYDDDDQPEYEIVIVNGDTRYEIEIDAYTGAITDYDTERQRSGWTHGKNEWYFVENGQKATGWVHDGRSWYYLKNDGRMATGWVQDGRTWYYLKSNGAMATGWIRNGRTWYYLKSNGAMATGWIRNGGSWYYLKSNGAMATGWIQDGSTWYYLKSSGAMVTGVQRIGNKQHVFAGTGAWLGEK